ncbi:MAG: hypothetical protein KUG76_02425 [Gammaproteobacteria bacterium]|nr:hypothetical protein [Gammaproteobacteria bacterium]
MGANLLDLETKKHHAKVVIEDGCATTSVEQLFYNLSDKVLDTVYSFSVPSKVAVGEFTCWIDVEPIVGEALKRA